MLSCRIDSHRCSYIKWYTRGVRGKQIAAFYLPFDFHTNFVSVYCLPLSCLFVSPIYLLSLSCPLSSMCSLCIAVIHLSYPMTYHDSLTVASENIKIFMMRALPCSFAFLVKLLCFAKCKSACPAGHRHRWYKSLLSSATIIVILVFVSLICCALPFLSAAAVSIACECAPGASRWVRAHRLQDIRWLLHTVKHQWLIHLDRLGCFIPGLSESNILGCVWLRCQRNDPSTLLFLLQ